MRNKLAKGIRQYVREKMELETNLLILGVEPTEYEFIKHTKTGNIQAILRQDSPRRFYKLLKRNFL